MKNAVTGLNNINRMDIAEKFLTWDSDWDTG